ncbi:MAG: flagellar biosynthetic protein FliP [Phenylobacterium sp.]|jgi:flagellar biosynthetic protein FliP
MISNSLNATLNLFAASSSANMGIIGQLQQSPLLDDLAPELKVVGMMTLMSFIPLFIISMTAFTRIIIVLSMLRQALGVQQTPPNAVLITLAIFMTYFTMAPAIEVIEKNAITPYLQQQITLDETITRIEAPLRAFMIHQTREADFAVILKVSNTPVPASANDISTAKLIPAFMLSELTTAFKMAFVIFLPFLLVDLVVASILMSLGMIMVPPITIALPLKIMLFVVIDGWALITEALISSFS